MPEWTPGPWKVNATGRDIYDAKGQTVVAYGYERDAHLIAAAPELFEALETLWQHENADEPGFSMSHEEVARKVYAALAKARGGDDDG